MTTIKSAVNFILLAVTLLALGGFSSCNQSKIAIDGVDKKSGGKTNSGPTITVSNVDVVANQLVINGTNLDSATSIRVTGPAGFDETFDIESKVSNQVIANAQSNLNMIVNGLFSLIVSNAYGAATYTITFDLQDGQVTAAKLSGMGAAAGDVLTYNGSSWGPAPLTGLSYEGTYDATSATDQTGATPASGHYYIVQTAGSIDPDGITRANTYSVGDWAVYNGTTSTWDKVVGSSDVTSVNGQTGVVTLGWADFSKAGSLLSDIANVDVTGRNTGDMLTWSGSNWIVTAPPTDTNTNASTICAAGQVLLGDGSCSALPTDTNAASLCSAGEYLDGDGTCKTAAVNTNAGTLCSAGQYLDGDGTCKTVPTDTDTDTNAGTLCSAGEYLDGDGTCKTAAAAVTSLSIGNITNAGGEYFIYRPNNVACADGEVLKWDNGNSRWDCGNDDGTAYSAGTGLSLSTTTFNVDVGTGANQIVQLDGSGNLPALDGSALTNVTAATASSVNVDDVASGAGLYFTYLPNNAACTAGQVLEWDNANSRWVCGDKTVDTDTDTTYSAGTGLSASGTTFNVDVGTGANQIVQLDGSGNLPAVDGSALTNVAAATAASVNVDDIANGAGLYFTYQPNNTACADGEVLKWSTANSRWECGTDTGGSSSDAALLRGENLDPSLATNTTTDGQILVWSETNSRWEVGAAPVDTDTTYSAGTGLNASGTTFSVDVGTGANQIVQLDGSGNLPALDGSALTNVTAGTVNVDDVANGAGLYFGYQPNNTACADGEVLKWDNTNSRWDCGTDTDTNVSSLSVGSITNAASEYFVYRPNNTACADGEVLEWDNTNSRWVCGTAAGGSDNLGNHTATTNIQLGTNWLSGDGGSEGIYVLANGNVGAGTATPSHRFTVANNVVELMSLDRTADANVDDLAVMGVGYASAGDDYFWLGTGSANRYFNVKLNDGKVGIGSTDPGSLLQVGSGTVNADSFITLGKRVTAGQINLPFIGHTSYAGTDNSLALGTHSADGKVSIFTGNTGTKFNDSFRRMTVDQSGNVNIGNSITPNEILTVEGNVSLAEGSAPTATSGFGKLYVNSTDSKLYFMDDAGTSYDLTASGGGSDNLGNHTATANIQLGSNYLSGDGGNEGLTIDATGNVSTTAAFIMANDQPVRWGASYILGNGGSNNLRFHTNGAEQMRLNGNNLGLGLVNPNEKLTVNGAVSIQEGTAPTNTANFGKLYVNSTDSKLYFIDDAGTSFDLTADNDTNTNAETICADGEYLDGDGSCYAIGTLSQWTTSGSDIFYNSGVVGVGTTTPTAGYALDAGGPVLIQGNIRASADTGIDFADGNIAIRANNRMGFRATRAGAIDVILGDSADATGKVTTVNEAEFQKNVVVKGTDVSNTMSIVNESSTAARIPSFKVQNFTGGNGGYPAIDLTNARGASGTPVATNAADPAGLLQFWGHDGTAAQRIATIGAYTEATTTGASSPGFLQFNTTDTGTITPTEKMRITADGSVGINDNTPNEKLTLDGVISIKEGTSPTASGDYGKVFVKAADSKLYFMDDSGTEYDLTSGGGGSDNLGNHYATQNIQLGDNYISNDGDNEGISIDVDGNVNVGTIDLLGISRLQVDGNFVAVKDDSVSVVAATFSDTPDTAGSLVLGRARGTNTAPGYPQANDLMGSIFFMNQDFTSGSRISSYATELQSVSARGADLRFYTIPNTTTAAVQRMTITNAGDVGIGIAAPTEKLTVDGGINVTTGNDICIDGGNCLSSVSGGGETNTAANVGTGAGVYKDKTTAQLNFRSIASADSSITITQNTDDIDLAVASVNVDDIASGTGLYFTYRPNDTACTDGQVLKWVTANLRWECGDDTDTNTAYTAGNGIDSSVLTGSSQIAVELTAGTALSFNGVSGALETEWLLSGTDLSYSAGNVGIGIASPSEMLHVEGAGRFKGVKSSPDNANGIYLDYDGTPNIGRVSVGGSAGSILTFETNNSGVSYERMRIDNNGDVGIGTTTPSGYEIGTNSKYLELYGAGSSEINIDSAGNSTSHRAALSFSIGGNRTAFIRNQKTNTALTDGDLVFGTSDGTTLSEKMRIESGGHVGIGITNPRSILHVRGSNARPNFTNASNAVNALTQDIPGLELLLDGNQNAGTQRYGMGIKFMAGDNQLTTESEKFVAGIFPAATETIDSDEDGGHALEFFTTENQPGINNVPNRVMLINHDGNVVVGGATNPNERLTVEGVLSLQEVTAPTSSTNHGKVYVKSSDSRLYFMDDAGTEYNLTTGTGSGSFETTGDVKATGGLLWASDSSTTVSRALRLENTDDSANQNGVDIAAKLGGTEFQGLAWTQDTAWTSASPAGDKDASLSFGVLKDNVATNPMTLTSDGFLGIGLSDPTEQLTLEGDGVQASVGVNTFRDNSSGSKVLLRQSRGSRSAKTASQAGDYSSFSFRAYDGSTFGDAAEIRGGSDTTASSGSTPGRLRFYTTPSGSTTLEERMRIDSSGNVGIRETNPAVSLDVNSDGNNVASRFTRSTPNANIGTNAVITLRNMVSDGPGVNGIGVQINMAAETTTEGTANAIGMIRAVTTDATTGAVDSDIKLVPYLDGSPQADSLTVKSTGRVGIGTTNPTANLMIADASNPAIRISEGGSSSSYSEFVDIDATNSIFRKVAATGQPIISMNPVASDGTSNAKFRFFRDTNTTGAKFIEIFAGDGTATLDSSIAVGGNSYFNVASGNVGIGTNSPQEKLHVAGDASIDEGALIWREQNASAASFVAAQVESYIWDSTAGSEGTGLSFKTKDSGSENYAMDISDDIYVYTQTQFKGWWTYFMRDSDNAFGPWIYLEKNRGGGTPTAVLNGDQLGNIAWRGYDGSIWADAGLIRMVATEDFTTTANGAEMEFYTAPNGSDEGTTLRMIITHNGNVGIGTASPDQKFSVNGNASKTGGTAWAVFSDARLKTVTGRYVRSLEALRELEPVFFHYNEDNPLGIKDTEEQVGFVAQEVQKVIPEAVEEMESGYLQLQSDAILWAMLNSIKELDLIFGEQVNKNVAMYERMAGLEEQVKENTREIASLKEENAELKAKVESLEERLERLEKVLQQ